MPNASKLKIYGWQSQRSSDQTREIVAAPSRAAAARLAGYQRPDQMFNLGETGNSQEIEIATSKPGIVFWTSLNVSGPREYHESRRAGSSDQKARHG